MSLPPASKPNRGNERTVPSRGSREIHGALLPKKGGREDSSKLSELMKISDILGRDRIVPQLSSQTKEGILRELVHALAKGAQQVNEGRMIEVLLERESLGSTGIGEGVAIPHGKSKEVKEIMATFGRSLSGMDFQSLDGKLTHLFFLLIAPENSAGTHLKALAQVSRLMKDPSFRKRLMEARTSDDIYAIFSEGDEKG